MAQQFSDAARSELTAGISAGDTTITLADGSRFPEADAGTSAVSDANLWFKAVLQDETGFEIVYVRTHAVATTPNTLSNVLRGQEGTTARSFAAASVIGVRLTASDMANLWATMATKAAASHTHAQGDVTGLQTALAGKVDASDPRLSDAREWTAGTVDQAEAEAGTATTRRAWTAERVRQAMLGWWGGFVAKTTPVDADSIVIADSAASNAPKRLSWANAVAKLRGTFVEGPASSVDGQVALFDGTTGKQVKSGGALGSAAFMQAHTFGPLFNADSGSGRQAGPTSYNAITVTAASFAAPVNFMGLAAGVTYTYADKFTSNSSTYGGAANAVSAQIEALMAKMVPLPTARRYRPEFNVGRLTAAPSEVGIPITVSSVSYYLQTGANTWPFHQLHRGSVLTYAAWVVPESDPVVFPAPSTTFKIFIDGVLQPAGATVVLAPTDGPRHVRQVKANSGSVSVYQVSGFSLYMKPSATALIALPFFSAGEVDTGVHETYIPSPAAYMN